MRRASLLWGWLAENSAEIDFGALAKGGKANASETLSVSRHSACVVRCGAGVFRVRGTSHMEALARGAGKSSTEASRCSSLSHTHTLSLSLSFFLSPRACSRATQPILAKQTEYAQKQCSLLPFGRRVARAKLLDARARHGAGGQNWARMPEEARYAMRDRVRR